MSSKKTSENLKAQRKRDANKMKYINIKEFKYTAFKRWGEILKTAGMNEKYLIINKRSPCPSCGGTDRYTFVDKTPDQTCYCSKCSIGGDGVNMLSVWLDISFRAALILANDILSNNDFKVITKPPPEGNDKKVISKNKIRAFYKIIDSTNKTPSIQAIDYYKKRGLGDFTDKCIDSILYGNISYNDASIGTIRGKDGTYINSPAIVALMTRYESDDINGAMQIYLDDSQIKKHVPEFNKKKFINISSNGLVGSGVWLTKAKIKTLHVAEGLENLLSICRALNTRSGVACGTRSLLAKLEIPDFIQALHIWSDSDIEGVKDAEKLKDRCKNIPIVIIHTPPKGRDWNDVLIIKGAAKIKNIVNLSKSLN